MNIEVLVSTINNKNIELVKSMRIKTDAIIANQADEYSYEEIIFKNNTIKIVTTPDRGIGKNRNKSLTYATGDICLLADDDMVYVSNYDDIVKRAFNEIPDADIIIFNIDINGYGSQNVRLNNKIRKINLLNALNYGAPRIAIKRDSLLKKNIWFSTLYGGGALYSAGEDSLFLVEAIKKGMKVYTYPYKIADINQQESTWFKGYNLKYFYDKGIWIANAFPKIRYVLSVYYSYKFRNSNKNLSIKDIYMEINKGIKDFENNII